MEVRKDENGKKVREFYKKKGYRHREEGIESCAGFLRACLENLIYMN